MLMFSSLVVCKEDEMLKDGVCTYPALHFAIRNSSGNNPRRLGKNK